MNVTPSLTLELDAKAIQTAANCYADPSIAATGSGAAVSYGPSTLTDTSKAFTADALAGKPVTVSGSVISSGQAPAYTSTTVTDPSANWAAGSLAGLPISVGNIIGGRLNATTLLSNVTYTASSLTDASHNLQTNQLVGLAVSAAGGASTGVIASNTQTTITLTTNWVGGTPPTDSLYQVVTQQESGTIVANTAQQITVASTWSPATPAQNASFTIQVPAGKVTGSGGSVTYTPTSVSDTGKSFAANELAGQPVAAIAAAISGSGGSVSYTSVADSGATVTYQASGLTDTGVTFPPSNGLAGKTVVVGSVTGQVASNSATVITLTAPWSTKPADGSAYVIATLKDTSKSFVTNAMQGRTVVSGANTALVLSNDATTLTLATAWSPATPSSGAAYTILPMSYSGVVASNNATMLTLSSAWEPFTPPSGTPYYVQVAAYTRTVASNTSTAMTMTAAWSPVVPANGSPYTVINSQPTSACGVGTYQTTITFDPSKVQYVSSANGSWLTSTGRTLFPNPCLPATTATSVSFSCSTTGATPLGPTGTGALLTFAFKPAAGVALNSTTLVSQTTALSDIQGNIVDHVDQSVTLQFSRCADVSGNGFVTLQDIGQILAKVGLIQSSDPNWATDVKYDLNQNGAITLSDVGYALDEVGQGCAYTP